MKSKLSVLLLLSFLVSLIDPGVWLLPSAAAANPNTATFTGNGGGYHKTPIVEGLQTQVVKVSGKKVKSWSFTINGNLKGQLGSYNESTGKIELPPVNGKEILLYGTRESRMYYDIWRNSSGKQWTMAGEGTGAYTFTADASTIANGISQYPGEIPVRDSSGATIDARLRYSDGSAAAWSDALGAPETFKRVDKDETISYAFIEPSSVTITGAVPLSGQTITDTGKGKPGYGYVKVSLMLGNGNNTQGMDWQLLDGSSGNVQGRRYPLNSTTTWEAKTYSVEYTLTVTYEPIDASKPDLVADSIRASGMIELGKAATFTADYHNENLDINKSFTVNVKDVGTGTVLKSESVPSMKAGASRSLTFTSTFTSSAAKTFRLTVDSANTIDEASETNNTADGTFRPNEQQPTPTPIKNFSGDFDVIKPVIAYRDTFSLKPKDFVLNLCTYVSHTWQIKQGPYTYTSPAYSNYSTETSYPFDKWPSLLGVGTFQVYMILKTNCGEVQVGPKTLTITGPSKNSPPVIKIGWIDPSGDPTKPVSSTPQNERLTLNVLSISDPDPGDSVTFEGYDFSGSSSEWIRNLPNRFGGETMMWEYPNVTMDQNGFYSICATVRDQWGATGSGCTSINVVPPNPIPIINGPSQIREERPYSPKFDANSSYSPIKGRTIDHARDEWSGIREIYDTPGEYKIKLDVYDSLGLKSLQPAEKMLTVLEDMPPVPKLEFPSPALRNASVAFKNTSYSPDGDNIVLNQVAYRYDANNDGNYSEPEVTITMRADKTFDFKGAKVGRYRFKVYVKEDYGKEATGYFDFEVINDAPQVSFDVTSESLEPEPLVSVPISTKTMAEDRTKWGNSNFGAETKISSWVYNPANGALAAPWATFNRAELFMVGSDGYPRTVRSNPVDDRSFTGFMQSALLSGGVTAISNYDKNTYVYTYDFYRDGVKIGSRTGLEGIVAVDLYTGIVHTRLYGDASKIRSYYADSFLNPAGTPFAIRGEVYANGKWIKVDYPTVLGTTPNLNAGSLPTAFSDHLYYYAEYQNSSNGTPLKTSFTWDGVKSEKQWYNNTEYEHNYILGAESIVAGSVDKDMNYVTSSYRTFSSSSKVYFSRNLEDDTDRYQNLIRTPDDRIFVTFDGKWVVTNTGVYDRNHPYSYADPISSFDYGTRVMHVTDTNYALLDNYERGAKLIRIQDNGTITTIRDYPQLQSIYRNIRIDNQNNFVFQDRETLYKISTSDFSLTQLAAVGNFAVPINNGAFTVATNDRRTEVYAPRESRPEGAYISSHNQLLGQAKMKNVSYSFKMKLNMSAPSYLYSGYSFHAQDNRNMYRVEVNHDSVSLVRVAGGTRKVLQSASYPINLAQKYTFKIQVLDGKIKVYVDGTPVIDINETTYTEGKFGPFAEIPKTEFFQVSYTDLTPISTSTVLNGVGLVGRPLIYTIRNTDTENDPLIKDLTSWKYVQLAQKFLDAQDGKSGASALSGKWFTSPAAVIDKVGLYRISYKSKDDPHPDYLYPKMDFDEYRKESNESVRDVIIHRPPISDFDVSLASNGTVLWTDRSRDPDRYLSSSHYSTEATGIDYYRTKGVLEKKFYYLSPSGKFVRTKLVTPDEIGEYTVGLAVKDEYEAWSDYTEKTVYVGTLPQPDEPPHAGFNLSRATTYRGVEISIDSTAWDKEDGARQNLPHDYFIRNLDGGTEKMASQARTTWTKTFSTMGTFRIRQVVEDKLGQTDTVSKTVQVVNRIPTANIFVPSSTDQTKPEKLTEFRPKFKWSYGDADSDPQAKYQVKIYRYGGVIVHDSGIKNGSDGTYIPTADLPEYTNLYIVVRVLDGFDWGESAPKFFYIETNRPPVADFDWTPKPVYEGDPLQMLDRSSDPDGDALTAKWTVLDPSGRTSVHAAPPLIERSLPGTYQVTLTVSDGKAEATAAKPISVVPLGLSADVGHTADWKEIHDRLGHETAQHPKEFYAGEKLIVQGYPVPAPVLQVTASLTAGGGLDAHTILKPVTADRHYAGELHDERWAHLTDGLSKGAYTIRFEVVYRNGTRKTADVPIRIIGSALGAAGVHRKQ
ncbi:Beta-galactosidase [Paenibacillus pasadenensis]|uniref:Beta-galactosidase n=1 Tax=Paenibacillus pasadenensis TaxID=217090 RepID=A0A2N5N821_9BACL|nr:CARDB domain-containing protein [Paenibacillus pasadenensis]PLT46450.1 Beta-galactosidase [Paenibacillus pasadenensis]